MCLGYISKEVERRFGDKRFGWKVFKKDGNNKLHPPLMSVVKNYLPYNKWIHEKDFKPLGSIKPLGSKRAKKYITTYDFKYEVGWHICLTREDARKWKGDNNLVIRKVKFRNPTAFGRQDGLSIVVTKEMLIIKNSKG